MTINKAKIEELRDMVVSAAKIYTHAEEAHWIASTAQAKRKAAEENGGFDEAFDLSIHEEQRRLVLRKSARELRDRVLILEAALQSEPEPPPSIRLDGPVVSRNSVPEEDHDLRWALSHRFPVMRRKWKNEDTQFLTTREEKIFHCVILSDGTYTYKTWIPTREDATANDWCYYSGRIPGMQL